MHVIIPEIPTTMTQEILLSPEALEKRRRIVELRAELADLFEKRDYMISQEKPRLTALYIDLVGKLQYEEFVIRVEVMKIKRKHQIIQAALNRGERPDTEVVERIVELEFIDYQAQIEAQAESIKAAKSYLEAPLMTEEDASDLKRIYRILIKRLHPDWNPDLSERSYILDQMFRATPAEVARLNDINESLRQHVRNMERQLTALYKADVDYSRGKDLDEMYEAELFAYPLLTETFDGADYYGSDFDKILEIEYELLSDNGLEPVASLRIYPSENTSCDPDHLKIDNLDLFQDDDDWTEYWTRVPALHNIRFCHSLHHMSDHQNLPLVDILHKTSFSIDIKHTITLDK